MLSYGCARHTRLNSLLFHLFTFLDLVQDEKMNELLELNAASVHYHLPLDILHWSLAAPSPACA